MHIDNTLKQQKEYCLRHAEEIMRFARAMRVSLGRGVVVLEWSWPPIADSAGVPDNMSYLGRDGLAATGFGSEKDLTEAVLTYDPASQTLIICVARWERRFNVHKLTAVFPAYAPTTPMKETSH